MCITIKFLPHILFSALFLGGVTLFVLYFIFKESDSSSHIVSELSTAIAKDVPTLHKTSYFDYKRMNKVSNASEFDTVLDQEMLNEVSLASSMTYKKEVIEVFNIEDDLRVLGVSPSVSFLQAKQPVDLDSDFIQELVVSDNSIGLKKHSIVDVSVFEANDTVPKREASLVKPDDGLMSDMPDISVESDEAHFLLD